MTATHTAPVTLSLATLEFLRDALGDRIAASLPDATAPMRDSTRSYRLAAAYTRDLESVESAITTIEATAVAGACA
jgi:hypothetical protein